MKGDENKYHPTPTQCAHRFPRQKQHSNKQNKNKSGIGGVSDLLVHTLLELLLIEELEDEKHQLSAQRGHLSALDRELGFLRLNKNDEMRLIAEMPERNRQTRREKELEKSEFIGEKLANL